MKLVRRDVNPGDSNEPEKRTFRVRPGVESDPEWFRREKRDPALGPAMVAYASDVAKRQPWRRSQNLRLARLYDDRDLASVYSVSGQAGGATLGIDGILGPKRSSWNIVRAACDVAQARVGKNRGRVLFVSIDGDWHTRRKAKLRTRFIDGAFRQSDFYAESQRVFLDAAVFGIGVLEVYSEHGQFRCERVLPDEITVEHGEAIHGKPRTIYRRRPIPRGEAIRRYAGKPGSPGYDERLRGLTNASSSTVMIGTEIAFATSDVIDIWTATTLPSAPGAKDGRRVVAVEGATLADETWDRPRHRYAIFRWGTSLSGWYGKGIAEQLVGTQLKLRQLQWQISAAEYHTSNFKWFIKGNASKVNVKHFNNDPRGSIIEYFGDTPPQPVTVSSVPPELFQDLEREWQHGFDQVGLPPAGSGVIPPSLKSGEAIRAYGEAIDGRLAVPAQRWDQYAVDAAEIYLDEAGEMGDVQVPVKAGRDRWGRVSWKDISEGAPAEAFYLQPWPTSILPATPSGRFDRLDEMVQRGWVTKEQAMASLEVPDLEGILSAELSSYELIGMQLENMLDEGKTEQPEPYQDLGMALKTAQAAYIRARVERAPDNRLSLVRDFIDAVRELQAQQAPQQPPQPMQPPAGAAPPPGAPPPDMGAPMAPPPGAMAA